MAKLLQTIALLAGIRRRVQKAVVSLVIALLRVFVCNLLCQVRQVNIKNV